MSSLGWEDNKRIGIYGRGGHPVIVLHGGPGAPGSSEHIAKGLADEFRVFEPWQRGSGEEPLTVAVHISDLHQLINSRCPEQKPVLVGESWGAMLALAYAAEHPERIGPIVLVSCGTFDAKARTKVTQTRRERIIAYIKKNPEHSADLKLSISEQITKWHEMTDAYEPVADMPRNPQPELFDSKAHTQTWNDMLRCQREGIYPQSFTAIKSPVLMLHGDYDPHPGRMIRDNLLQYIPHLEYYELARCGHAPAIEKHAKDEFFKIMHKWIKAKLRHH